MNTCINYDSKMLNCYALTNEAYAYNVCIGHCGNNKCAFFKTYDDMKTQEDICEERCKKLGIKYTRRTKR